MMNRTKLNRRQFLKTAAAAGTLAIPTLLGYRYVQLDQGEYPQIGSPYVTDEAPQPQLSAPILVLSNDRSDNPFGPYLAEILRAEGLNCFQTADLSALDRTTLDRFKLVLLAEGPTDRAQVTLLERYVFAGGQLVAMRPDKRLASLLGLETAAGNSAEGYLHFEADHPLGQEQASGALQFHGTADYYRLAGATALAWLGAEANARSDFPAVTLHSYGEGQAAAWAFDLARSVAYTRQGNPAWANQERDGADGVRAHDAFLGWLDLERIAIPQADEQMRLLSRSLGEMVSAVLPLPRLWYFPGSAERMLIASGDSHQNVAFAIEEVLGRVEQRGGHMSIYYTPPHASKGRRALRKARWWAADLPLLGPAVANPNTLPSPALIAGWRARGHEFTFHPEVEKGVDAGYKRFWREFTAAGYGPLSATVRTHRILWTGWTETARLQASYGLRMNLDYYHIGPAFQNEAGEWVYGHFTGSGLPMKFVDEEGRILNIYQQLTQLVDEHLLLDLGGWAQLDYEQAVEVSKQVLSGAPSAVCAQFHVDPFHFGGTNAATAAGWLEGTLDYAEAQGIPIWPAARWLNFTQIRDKTTLDAITWHPQGKRLSFQLITQVTSQAVSDVTLTVMVPLRHGQAKLVQVEVDGRGIEHHQRTVGGVTYGWLSVEAGSHHVVATYA